ncbi:hypothetical protein CEXT_510701 [Caerostris extrusa]|uniref:Uncharacterized protein n=1 Tax=Caerostris extrusa TaxID=172846 RepID=A0AAV4WM52_CAEEX|nr:hypothetical protein CEXT_510701 [Caerostris extrusa]
MSFKKHSPFVECRSSRTGIVLFSLQEGGNSSEGRVLRDCIGAVFVKRLERGSPKFKRFISGEEKEEDSSPEIKFASRLHFSSLHQLTVFFPALHTRISCSTLSSSIALSITCEIRK